MSKSLTDSSTWTSAITVPVDADAANAASVEVGFQGLANRALWLRDLISPASPPSRTIRISASDMTVLSGTWTPAVPAAGSYMSQGSGGAVLSKDFRERIPQGATITGALVRCAPGVARAGANRIALRLYEITADTSGTQIGTSAFDNAGTGWQSTPALTGLSYSVSAATSLIVQVTSGNTANTDLISYVEITFNDPGPRSY